MSAQSKGKQPNLAGTTNKQSAGKTANNNWMARYTTNFHPQYSDGGHDRVTAIVSTRPTGFQKVLPNYDMSMSETRNTGLGPMFNEPPYQRPAYYLRRKGESFRSAAKSKKSKVNWRRKGIRYDFHT